MSYFNIMNLIEAGRKSLEDENYWSFMSKDIRQYLLLVL